MWRRSVLLVTYTAVLVGFSSFFLNNKGAEPWIAVAPAESALATAAPANAAMCPVESDTGQVYFVSCGGIY
jgi:hypothetical protein